MTAGWFVNIATKEIIPAIRAAFERLEPHGCTVTANLDNFLVCNAIRRDQNIQSRHTPPAKAFMQSESPIGVVEACSGT